MEPCIVSTAEQKKNGRASAFMGMFLVEIVGHAAKDTFMEKEQ